MAGSLSNLIAEIQAWQRVTFADETDEGRVAHLREEVRELVDGTTPEARAKEVSDVAFMLLSIAGTRGVCLSPHAYSWGAGPLMLRNLQRAADSELIATVPGILTTAWADLRGYCRAVGIDLPATMRAILERNKARKWARTEAGYFKGTKEEVPDAR